jgi:hypothetical protein
MSVEPMDPGIKRRIAERARGGPVAVWEGRSTTMDEPTLVDEDRGPGDDTPVIYPAPDPRHVFDDTLPADERELLAVESDASLCRLMKGIASAATPRSH